MTRIHIVLFITACGYSSLPASGQDTNNTPVQELVTPLYRTEVRVLPPHYTDSKGNRSFLLVNTSDLPWRIKGPSAAFRGEVWLPRAGSAVIKLASGVQNLTLAVSNAHTTGEQRLRVDRKL